MSKPESLPPMGRKGVLLVDDEPLTTKYFSNWFSSRFPVFVAGSSEEAMKVLDANSDRIGVVVTDERMPQGNGVRLLEMVRTRHPQMIRILTTAYMDMETLLEAINVGSVFSFVAKPWELPELERVLFDALQVHQKQVRDAHLIERKIDDLRNQIIDNHVYDIGIIAGKLGHYVYNALCPITFLLDQLIEGKITNNYPQDFLQEVQRHVGEVVQTLKDLDRTSATPTVLAYESLDLPMMLEDALQQTSLSRKERRLDIDVEFSSDIPRIRGVRAEIEKLLRFMIAEQIISLPLGSRVRIRCAPQVVDSEILGIGLSFEDFVPLSPKIQAESLLYPFNLRSGNPREFGIFLACCYFIAKRHGGSLTARAKENEGVVYSFFLPYDPRETSDPTGGLFEGISLEPRRYE
jgi:CheY-like chemotaxis protein